jgi:hypothetical protein
VGQKGIAESLLGDGFLAVDELATDFMFGGEIRNGFAASQGLNGDELPCFRGHGLGGTRCLLRSRTGDRMTHICFLHEIGKPKTLIWRKQTILRNPNLPALCYLDLNQVFSSAPECDETLKHAILVIQRNTRCYLPMEASASAEGLASISSKFNDFAADTD